MIDPLGPDNLLEHLTAFADGELDARQTLAVLDHLTAHPESIALMRDQQRLRVAVERLMANPTAHPLPDALHQRLSALPMSEAGVNGDGPRDGRRWNRRLPLLMTSTLLAGVAAGVVLSIALIVPNAPPKVTTIAQGRDDAIPITLVHAATHVHIDCSRVAEHLHGGAYPTELGPVSQLVREDLASKTPAPDLTSIGYHFVGAGPCAKPLNDTVHLLYRKDGPEPRAAVSVFVQAYRDQFSLDVGTLYRVSGSDATLPMLAWRSNGVVYFLIADDPDTADAALRSIRSAPSALKS